MLDSLIDRVEVNLYILEDVCLRWARRTAWERIVDRHSDFSDLRVPEPLDFGDWWDAVEAATWLSEVLDVPPPQTSFLALSEFLELCKEVIGG